jgi:non-specific serine/threonine protein kinase/serine/threonine-protein kinase
MKDQPPTPRPPSDDITRPADGATESKVMIGPYRLLQCVGEGGMGQVWRAEQILPVRRLVAMKLLKAGMDTAQVSARFEAERQVLAVMDHPAIAKVFDAGATPEGRPYFVMEYVPGEPITTYCNRHRLSTRECQFPPYSAPHVAGHRGPDVYARLGATRFRAIGGHSFSPQRGPGVFA